MQIYRNRPLALSCMIFALSMLAAIRMHPLVSIALGLLCLVIILLLCLFKRGWHPLSLHFGAAVLALLLSLTVSVPIKITDRFLKPDTHLAGTVVEVLESTAYSGRYRIRVTEIDGKFFYGGAVLETEFATGLTVGDRIEAEGRGTSFDDDGYNESIYRYSQGEFFTLVCSDPEACRATGRNEGHPLVLLYRLNLRLSHRMYTHIGGEEGALCAALLWGDRDFLQPFTILTFRRTGTVHLLALSGMHVSILVGSLLFLLKLLRCPRRASLVLLPILGLVYLFATGMSPSACRAVLMMCIAYAGLFLLHLTDPFTLISQALALIIAVNPASSLDISLWMSFLAAAAVIIFPPLLEDWIHRVRLTSPGVGEWLYRLRKPVEALFVGIVANLALLLPVWSISGQISLLSVPWTLLLSIPITLLLYLSALTAFLPFLAPVTRLTANAVLTFVGWGSGMDGILLPVDAPLPLLFMVLLSAFLIWLAVGRLKHPRVLWTVPVLCLCLFVSSKLPAWLPHKGLSVVVEQAYSGEVMVISRGDRCVAVDLANGTDGRSTAIARLASDGGCTQVDELILTRYYNRIPHLIYGLGSQIRVSCVRMPPPLNQAERDIARRVEEEAALLDIEVRYDTQAFSLSDMEVLVWRHTPLTDESSLSLFSFRGGEQIMTVMNGAVYESELSGVASNIVSDSNTLLLCRRASGEEPVPLTPATQRLLLGNDKLEMMYIREKAGRVYETVNGHCSFYLE